MKLNSNKITINAISAVIQVVFTAFLFFFLYKYLLNSIGVKQLGIWSLILSFSSIANLANLGLTSGLVKFVAEFALDEDKSKLGKLIFTSGLSMSFLFIIISLIIYFGANFFLNFIIDKQFLGIALKILPYSLASLSINAIGGVFTSVLEGFQKNYIRNFIYIISGVIMFVATYILTPHFQLEGVAMAQLLQSVFIFVFALIFVLRINTYNRFSYWKWSNSSFKELFNYGYKFQLVSISQLLYEPATKLLLSKYGGLALLGHYEMATKAVNQFRALLTNANQVIVPIIAEKSKTDGNSFIQDFYIKMNRILFLFNLPLSTILILITPVISILWIGDYNYDFVFSMYILVTMTFINVMCGPAYFSSLGEGKLNMLVLVHVGMAIINILIGLLLGHLFGGYGIILAWGISLSIGSIVLIINYNKSINVKLSNVFQKDESKLLFVSLLIIVISIISNVFIQKDYFAMKITIVILSLTLYLPILLRNTFVKQFISLTKKKRNV